MVNSIQNLIKPILIISVLWVFLFGLFQPMMSMDITKPNINCPFSGHSEVICQMNPMEHIEEWQNMFTALPAKNALLFLFILLIFVVLGKLKFWSKFSIPKPLLAVSSLQSLFINFQTFNSFKELFSNGILNPKIF